MTNPLPSLDALLAQPSTHSMSLELMGVALSVSSNSALLLGELSVYFAGFRAAHTGLAPVPGRAAPMLGQPRDVLRIQLLEGPSYEPPITLEDWPTEAGKAAKERFADLPEGRLVQKSRTGLVFWLGHRSGIRAALGPCRENLSQVVNFLIAQLQDYHGSRGWLLCHAAAVTGPRGALIISGRSGQGKTSLLLWLVSAGAEFVSNDRLLLDRDGSGRVLGVPKWPRANPGTLLQHPVLCDWLSPQERAELTALSAGELWRLERKRDIDISRWRGPAAYKAHGEAFGLLLIDWVGPDQPHEQVLSTSDWSRPSSAAEDARLELVTPEHRGVGTQDPRLLDLEALCKAPGALEPRATPLLRSVAPEPYQHALRGGQIFVLRGRADLPRAAAFASSLLGLDNELESNAV